MDKYIEIFEKYVNKFEQNNKIILKKEHTLRVALNSYNLAKSLKLSDDECSLAYLIGLFHDLGRFKQIVEYDTFSDRESKINHAELSVNILYKEGLINKFIDNTLCYDEIIKKAIINHNIDKIDDDLSYDEKTFAKILRDADKLDILNIITFDNINDIFWFSEFEDLEINPDILNSHLNEELINYNDIKNNLDLLVSFYNYVYDINFSYTKEKILNDHLYEKITKRMKKYFNNNDIIDVVYNKAINYLKK